MSSQLSTGSSSSIHPLPLPAVIRLNEEQFEALRSCSKGISLRFERWEIVNPLLDAGLVEKNLAGVIRVTKEGHEYVRSHVTSQ